VQPGAPDIERLLTAARTGERDAVAALTDTVYAQLRHVAAAYMRRESPGQTLQATALVHEAFIRLVRDRQVSWQDSAHFRAIAARSMRQILVERARARHAKKRGGMWQRITLDERTASAPPMTVGVAALDEALERLAAHDPQRAQLVELRFFGGLTIEETAAVLGVSPATVKRGWALAKAWLRRELETDARQQG
jgi:RNA polymerase sigma-70 factor, ECF subfamily